MLNFKVNDIFHNRYQLIKLVGKGGMSTVWEAEDTLTGTIVAVKIYSFSGQLDHMAKESFRNEFKLMYNLTHPNLFRPTHFDTEPESQSPYLVSKYYSKGSAESIINNTDCGIDESVVAHFLHNAASALHYLHTLPEPIIHQDLKPDNFLIDDDGKYILSDFGVSIRRRATRLMANDEGLKAAGDTPYVAPERFTGAYAKPAQDIFSLGVTLYEILTGVLPFQHFGGKLLNQGHEVPELDSAFGYTARLNTICQHCMQLLPEARPSAQQILQWTEFYLSNQYWPDVPKIDVNAIKGRKKYKEAQHVFDRFAGLKVNELDYSEVRNCIADFQRVGELGSEFSDYGQYVEKLRKLEGNVNAFNQIEEEYNRAVNKEDISLSALEALRKKYNVFRDQLTERFYQQRVEQLERMVVVAKERQVAEEGAEKERKGGAAVKQRRRLKSLGIAALVLICLGGGVWGVFHHGPAEEPAAVDGGSGGAVETSTPQEHLSTYGEQTDGNTQKEEGAIEIKETNSAKVVSNTSVTNPVIPEKRNTPKSTSPVNREQTNVQEENSHYQPQDISAPTPVQQKVSEQSPAKVSQPEPIITPTVVEKTVVEKEVKATEVQVVEEKKTDTEPKPAKKKFVRRN